MTMDGWWRCYKAGKAAKLAQAFHHTSWRKREEDDTLSVGFGGTPIEVSCAESGPYGFTDVTGVCGTITSVLLEADPLGPMTR